MVVTLGLWNVSYRYSYSSNLAINQEPSRVALAQPLSGKTSTVNRRTDFFFDPIKRYAFAIPPGPRSRAPHASLSLSLSLTTRRLDTGSTHTH